MPKIEKTEQAWRAELSPEQYHVLREKGTERPFTGEYDHVFEPGTYRCAGCGAELFSSDTKYESGTGWPSFFTTIPGVFETKKDFFLIYPRTEYHCKRCGGHHGHLFDDGPPPTGQRWCNNGVALKFIAKDAKV
jgi:peptide-methionine (R)-S-oxide reductase